MANIAAMANVLDQMKIASHTLFLVFLMSAMQGGCVLPARPNTLANGKTLIGCWSSSNTNFGLFRLDLRLESDRTFHTLVWGHDGTREWAGGIWHVKGSSLVLEPNVANLSIDFKEAHLASSHLVIHDPLQSNRSKFTLDGFSYFGPLARTDCSDFDIDATH